MGAPDRQPPAGGPTTTPETGKPPDGDTKTAPPAQTAPPASGLAAGTAALADGDAGTELSGRPVLADVAAERVEAREARTRIINTAEEVD